MNKPITDTSKQEELEEVFCNESGCLRKIYKPYLYCDKHQDNASTPPTEKELTCPTH